MKSISQWVAFPGIDDASLRPLSDKAINAWKSWGWSDWQNCFHIFISLRTVFDLQANVQVVEFVYFQCECSVQKIPVLSTPLSEMYLLPPKAGAKYLSGWSYNEA